MADDLLDLGAHGLERDAERLERLGGDALALVDQAEQDVLGPDVVVVEQPRFFLRQDDDSAGPVGESVRTWRPSSEPKPVLSPALEDRRRCVLPRCVGGSSGRPQRLRTEYTRGLPFTRSGSESGRRAGCTCVHFGTSVGMDQSGSPVSSEIRVGEGVETGCAIGTTQIQSGWAMWRRPGGWQPVKSCRRRAETPGGKEDPTSAVDLTYGEDTPVRVLVVDDHPAFRHALSSALSLVADIEVAGEAGGGVAGVHRGRGARPRHRDDRTCRCPTSRGSNAMKRVEGRRANSPW